MSETSKQLSLRDYTQTLKGAFNDVDKSLTTNGFLVGKVGHKIVQTAVDPANLAGAAAGDEFSFYDTGVLLYTYRILYSDLAKTLFISAERTA